MTKDIYALSNREMVATLGKRFQQYRKRMGFTQKTLSEKTGTSIFTISSFEKGTGTGLSLSTFIALMRAVEGLEQIEALLPEQPRSPKDLFEEEQKRGKR